MRHATHRALAGIGQFAQEEARRFALNRVAQALLRLEHHAWCGAHGTVIEVDDVGIETPAVSTCMPVSDPTRSGHPATVPQRGNTPDIQGPRGLDLRRGS